MRRRTKIIFILLATLLAKYNPAYSQQKAGGMAINASIKVIGKSYKDSVVLRWAPDNMLAWQRAIKGVYIIERTTLSKDTVEFYNQPYKVISDSIKCMTLAAMKNYLGKDSKLGAIAAQAIYGKEIVTNPNGPADLFKAKTEQQSRYSFALFAADNDQQVANALGIRFVDHNVKPGYYYAYRVKCLLSDRSVALDTGFTIVSTIPQKDTAILPVLEAEGIELAVKLKWNAQGFDKLYGTYTIEKRRLNTNNWYALEKLPIISGSGTDSGSSQYYYLDSIGKNYEKYEYRLTGITPFADKITSGQVVLGQAKDITPPAMATGLAVESININDARISWKKGVIEIDCKGFHVQKAYFVDGPWVTISPELIGKNTTSFIDTQFDVMQSNYYRVLTADTAGNVSASFSIFAILPDSVAPSKPMMPAGNINNKGVVNLHWPKGKERDIMGYRVYRANQADHVFINITPVPIADTTFTDTISIATLTKKVFYKIVAVDFHYNHSIYSEPLALKRPDIMPPGSPVFSDILITDTMVSISWHSSPSDDVKETILFRQKNNFGKETIARFNNKKTTTYYDKNILPKNTYRYFLVAVDEDNLTSDTCKLVDAYIYDNGIRKPIDGLTASYKSTDKSVHLNWSYSAAIDGYFVIYRSENNSPFEPVINLSSEKREYSDVAVLAKKNYKYSIVFFTNDGSQTKMGKPTEVFTN